MTVALGDVTDEGHAARVHVAVRLAFLHVACARGARVRHPAEITTPEALFTATTALGPGLVATREAFPSGLDVRELVADVAAFVASQPEPLLAPGVLYETHRGALDRRRGGAHYTPRAVCEVLAARALAPVAGLDVRVCDPSMGSGAMLVAAANVLATRGEAAGLSATEARARAVGALFGVDQDPAAVELARMTLWLVAGAPDEAPSTFAEGRLVHGDALIGLATEELDGADAAEALAAVRALTREEATRAFDGLFAAWLEARPSARRRAVRAELDAWAIAGVRRRLPSLDAAAARLDGRLRPFHWWLAFGEVLERGGFDAFLGNPPWVSYAGRAAQPLEPALRSVYLTSPAFHGYRNLQALFVRRSAAMLAPGGRLGFVLPTSTSDLAGYAPSRRAHDELSACDAVLPDFGSGGFAGVFQPCMGLLSTRRPARVEATGGAWPLERSDRDRPLTELALRLSALPKLPARVFGERGYQTRKGETALFSRTALGRRTVGVRTGTEVAPFRLAPPRLYCDPAELGGHFRSADEWRGVDLLVRQTARFPVAAPSDGGAFRNSVLAVFAEVAWPKELLLAYLNSSPLRFCHYWMHRDARQGMPQLKIGHLRALPAPLAGPATERLMDLGRTLGAREQPLDARAQSALDDAAADALELSTTERAWVADWARTVR